MAVHLRRRNQQRVMETMAVITRFQIAHEFACAGSDFDVDRMDSVAEGRNESLEPLVQRPSAFRMAGADTFDGGLELDQGHHREENRFR